MANCSKALYFFIVFESCYLSQDKYFFVSARIPNAILTCDCESALEGAFGTILGAPNRGFGSSKLSDGDDVLGVDFLDALASAADA